MKKQEPVKKDPEVKKESSILKDMDKLKNEKKSPEAKKPKMDSSASAKPAAKAPAKKAVRGTFNYSPDWNCLIC